MGATVLTSWRAAFTVGRTAAGIFVRCSETGISVPAGIGWTLSGPNGRCGTGWRHRQVAHQEADHPGDDDGSEPQMDRPADSGRELQRDKVAGVGDHRNGGTE